MKKMIMTMSLVLVSGFAMANGKADFKIDNGDANVTEYWKVITCSGKNNTKVAKTLGWSEIGSRKINKHSYSVTLKELKEAKGIDGLEFSEVAYHYFKYCQKKGK